MHLMTQKLHSARICSYGDHMEIIPYLGPTSQKTFHFTSPKYLTRRTSISKQNQLHYHFLEFLVPIQYIPILPKEKRNPLSITEELNSPFLDILISLVIDKGCLFQGRIQAQPTRRRRAPTGPHYKGYRAINSKNSTK